MAGIAQNQPSLPQLCTTLRGVSRRVLRSRGGSTARYLTKFSKGYAPEELNFGSHNRIHPGMGKSSRKGAKIDLMKRSNALTPSPEVFATTIARFAAGLFTSGRLAGGWLALSFPPMLEDPLSITSGPLAGTWVGGTTGFETVWLAPEGEVADVEALKPEEQELVVKLLRQRGKVDPWP